MEEAIHKEERIEEEGSSAEGSSNGDSNGNGNGNGNGTEIRMTTNAGGDTRTEIKETMRALRT